MFFEAKTVLIRLHFTSHNSLDVSHGLDSQSIARWMENGTTVELFSPEVRLLGGIRRGLVRHLSFADNTIEITLEIPYEHATETRFLVKLMGKVGVLGWSIDWVPKTELNADELATFIHYLDFRDALYQWSQDIRQIASHLDPATTKIGQWLSSRKTSKTKTSSTDQARKTSISSNTHVFAEIPKKVAHENRCKFGIFSVDERLVFAFIPWSTDVLGSTHESPLLPLQYPIAGWTLSRQGYDAKLDDGFAPSPIYLQIFPLGVDQNERPAEVGTWRTMVQVPAWDKKKRITTHVYWNSVEPNACSPASMLFDVWNAAVERLASASQVHGGRPFMPAPTIRHIVGDSNKHVLLPVFRYASDVLPSNNKDLPSPRLIDATFRHVRDSNDREVELKFWLRGAGALAPAKVSTKPDVIVKGLIVSDKDSIAWQWKSSSKAADLLPEGDVLKSYLRKALEDTGATRVAFEIELLSATGSDGNRSPWLNLGALSVRPQITQKTGSLRCTMRGRWDSDVCDLHPEIELELICDVRSGQLDDPPDQEITAGFDIADEDEASLQRESSAMLWTNNENEIDLYKNGTLSIRMRTEPGLNPVLQMQVKGETPKDQPKRFYFNARPFTVAQLHPTEILPEALGEAVQWRSDDPEGAQWRFGIPSVTFDFPPQAIGEEMERGRRFWPEVAGDRTPYIDPAHPLKYRFSPTTTVTVRPSLIDRRYQSSPANLREILREADVEAMTTEMVYPIQIDFKRDANRLPDVRIREAGEYFGKPAPNLPVFPTVGSDSTAFVRQVSGLLSLGVGRWYVANNGNPTEQATTLKNMRISQSAIRASYVSRLGVFNLYNPWRRDGRLALSEGLTFRIRGTKQGAPALVNPLPTGIDLSSVQKTQIQDFLAAEITAGTPVPVVDFASAANGAIRGGIVHTFEFPSELVAVLRNPTSERGVIDRLSFSALGATGSADASFDEARTTFSVDTKYGQLSRLVKTRIGRIGVVWNVAKHVVIYERTVTPSAQFEAQQTTAPRAHDPLRGWPVLRKTEEYVELVEPRRAFGDEEDSTDNRAGALAFSVFGTERIYVDSAWGQDLGHGYEVPLWNPAADQALYPKPSYFIEAFSDGDERAKQFHEHPEDLHFYSNTDLNAGADTNRWEFKAGVDFDPSLRPGRAKQNTDAKKVLAGEIAQPTTASYLPNRFNFRVRSEGPLNLQHDRSPTPMLARVEQLYLSRSNLTSQCDDDSVLLNAIPKLPMSLAEVFPAIARDLTEWAEDQVKSLKNVSLDCNVFKADAKSALQQKRVAGLKKIDDLLKSQQIPNPNFAMIRGDIDAHISILDNTLHAQIVLLRGIVDGADEVVARAAERAQAGLNDAKADVARAVDERRNVLINNFTAISAVLARSIAAVNDAALALSDLSTSGDVAADLEVKCDLALKKLLEARTQLATVGTPRLKPHANRVIAFIDFLGGQVKLLKSSAMLAPLQLSSIEFALKSAAGLLNGAAAQVSIAQARLEIITRDIAANLNTINVDLTQLDALDGMDASIFFGKAREILGESDAVPGLMITNFRSALSAALVAPLKDIDNVESALVDTARVVNKAVAGLSDFATAFAQAHLGITFDDVEQAIDVIDCNAFETAASVITAQAAKVTGAVQTWIDDRRDEVEKSLMELANSEAGLKIKEEVARLLITAPALIDKGSKALKLARVMGELPALPQLTFNAARAEYAFDDLKAQIETSAFAAKLREIDSGLKELGLAIPTDKLLDQFIPMALKNLSSEAIFKNIGGLEWGKKIFNFTLPPLDKNNIKVTPGIDQETRTPWVKTRINADLGAQDAFDIGPVRLAVRPLRVTGSSDVTVGADGTRRAITKSRITGDWVLNLSSQAMVTLRDVTIEFDGESGFKFDVSPDKVELNPSLKFISDIAKQFADSIPPNIQVFKDVNGRPTGLSASFLTSMPTLPPIGTFKIGPFDIANSFGLSTASGEFVISTAFSLGTRSKPVFVEVNKLGGGFYIESRVKFPANKAPEYSASLGLTLGSQESFDLAGVARGSYSLLLYAYLEITNASASRFAVGIIIAGSARILGIANASVTLVLEARQSGSKMEGHGTLDVEIEICWCYSVSVHEQVTHQL
jgi:hypothetical protein